MVSDRFSSFDCFLSSDSGFEDLVVKEVRDDSIGELCVIFQMLEMNHVLMWMLGSVPKAPTSSWTEQWAHW